MLFQMRALFATTAVECCGINEKKLKKTETLHNSKNMDCNNKPKGSSTDEDEEKTPKNMKPIQKDIDI